jgi:hypothetical protein
MIDDTGRDGVVAARPNRYYGTVTPRLCPRQEQRGSFFGVAFCGFVFALIACVAWEAIG